MSQTFKPFSLVQLELNNIIVHHFWPFYDRIKIIMILQHIKFINTARLMCVMIGVSFLICTDVGH